MDTTPSNPSPALPLSGEGGRGSPLTRGAGGVEQPYIILSRRTSEPATDQVALAYDERKRSRIKVTLSSGSAAGIFLERGEYLRGGDKLMSEDGSAIVEILAAPERLIEVTAGDPLLFARAAYHLGNRHVPVQIIAESGGGRLRFQIDHVLAEMARGLGCSVGETEAPFQPEAGAYGAHAASHSHEDAVPDLHHPGHGPHRSLPKIHEFKPR